MPYLITKTGMGWTETAPATSGDFFGGLMSMVEWFNIYIFLDLNARKREAPFLGIALQGENFGKNFLKYHRFSRAKYFGFFLQVRGLLLVYPLNSRPRHGVAGRANIMLDLTIYIELYNCFPLHALNQKTELHLPAELRLPVPARWHSHRGLLHHTEERRR